MKIHNLMLPGNPRYQPKELQAIFGYDNLLRPLAQVEIATLETLGELGVIPREQIALLTEEVRSQLLAIRTTDVDRVEREVTKHDVRAWVRLAQEVLPQPLRRWIHVPLTSYDALDTARALQFRLANEQVVRPAAVEVIELFASLVERYADVPQIGRTHGQHALPITVGFWLATILHRILSATRQMDRAAEALVGKISGAVGAYNAQVGLGFTGDAQGPTFEQRVLTRLGLEPAPISTQILPLEPLANYLFACVLLSGALGQFGRDCRQLMRSEITEVAEEFEHGQVGSSTMAHKRNPITFENLEGMYLRAKTEFGKVLDTLISEHQRDLVGSSLYRDFPIIVVNLLVQLDALRRRDKTTNRPFLSRLVIDKDACEGNLAVSANVLLAEPMYIALQMAGYSGDAHELINRRAVPLASSSGITLLAALTALSEDEPDLRAALSAIPMPISQLLEQPKRYSGHAREKALEIASTAREYIRV